MTSSDFKLHLNSVIIHTERCCGEPGIGCGTQSVAQKMGHFFKNGPILSHQDPTARFWLFASITFDHKLKKLAPQTVLRYETKTGRFLVRDFRVVTSQNKQGFLWPGTKTGRFAGRIFLRFVAFQNKNGTFCGQELFGLGR